MRLPWLLPLFRWLCLLMFAGPALAQIAPRLPLPRLVVPEAREPVRIASLALRSTVNGLQASTRLEMTLFNPNPRQLEATLEFPLAEAQTVSGFALDIGGTLVPAVPVPKDKGRQVFDDVTRARVDPALLERTAGNAFKLRVYPLPPQGTRRVVLQITETLRPDAQGRATWQLPLDFGQHVGRFDADIALPGVAAVQPQRALQGATVTREGSETVLRLSRADWQPREPLALQWTAPRGDTVAIDVHEGRPYFAAELRIDEPAAAPAPLPGRVTIVWDASGSGAARDHAREFALLDALFAGTKQVAVRLVVARDVAEPAMAFEVRDGDWRALRQALQRLAYDGASDAAAWSPPVTEGLVLLFSDGLANWGEGKTAATGGAVLHAINAAQRQDAARLRALAELRGGRFVDLTVQEPKAAAATLLKRGLRLVHIESQGAEQVLAGSIHPEGGHLSVAGVLGAVNARVNLVFADAAGRRSVRTLALAAPATPRETAAELVPPAAQRWAQLRIAQLQGERRLHRAQIRRLGEQFRLVSEETSLIVLESLADYLRFEIEPPAGPMQRAWREQIATRGRTQERQAAAQVEGLVRRFAERQRWWEREFPKDTPPRPVPLKEAARDEAGERREASGQMLARQRADAARPAVAAMAPPPPAPSMLGATAANKTEAEAGSGGSGNAARIALRPFQPDAPYARRLHEAGDAERYAVYLDERPGFADSTAFFVDAAEVFFAKGQTALAIRVLSNLAEMELENRHILRIVAYRLVQANRHALALPLLERVREIAPDEPQSWRDLGLALAAANQPQRALEMLWAVCARPWDARFADIDLIALGELNALVARTKEPLDTSRVDPRLLRNLPLDLRAVLAWDADNTDIDLWVTDPNGERAYYGHRLTYQGGAMSRDFTGGYGPEEFSLRSAKPGRYEVRAQFYGHRQQIVSPYTTLMLWLATGFGTPGQKDEQVVLRLSGSGQEVFVGSFEVTPPAR